MTSYATAKVTNQKLSQGEMATNATKKQMKPESLRKYCNLLQTIKREKALLFAVSHFEFGKPGIEG